MRGVRPSSNPTLTNGVDMSLEEALAANTAAVTKHTAALEKFMAQGKAGGASAGGAAADKGGDKPGKAETNKTNKKAVTLEDIQNEAGEYMTVSDADERKKRKANIAKINEHFGVERISHVDASDYEEAIGYLRLYAAGKKVQFKERPEADATDEDEGDAAI